MVVDLGCRAILRNMECDNIQLSCERDKLECVVAIKILFDTVLNTVLVYLSPQFKI